MKITDSMLTTFLNLDAQSEIPIFQRQYEWKEEHVVKLLDDIVSISKKDNCNCHFIGSIIYKNEKINDEDEGIKRRTIVDGQQRLTTISLLLLALEDYQNEIDPNNKAILKQICRYQYNDTTLPDKKVKLKHNGNDCTAYYELINNRQSQTNYLNNYCIKNYQIILKYLRERGENPAQYIRGIEKLKIVDILIEDGDDAEAIFETVNTTGLDLSNTEIIKNYILMTVPPTRQLNLYSAKWYPMESYFLGRNKGQKEFELFFKYYIRSVTGSENDEQYFYKDFKRYVEEQKDTNIETLISTELVPYFNFYKQWKDVNKWESDKLKRRLYYLKMTKNDIFLPVILKILFIIDKSEKEYKYSIGTDSEQDKKQLYNNNKTNGIQIFDLLDSYISRRMVCGYESKSLGKIWLRMISIVTNPLSIDNFKKLFKEMDAKDSEQKMPNDSTLLSSGILTNIYSKNKWLNYFLSRIENDFENDCRPEYHGSWTIEHIMPQTIMSEEELINSNKSEEEKQKLQWAKELGDNWKYVHEKYKDTLGNLTLLGYKSNSELQNYTFLVKKNYKSTTNKNETGYSNSPIYITSMLKEYDEWGERQIIERAKILLNRVSKIWKYYN